MAIAAGPDDATISVILELATALKEQLIVVTKFGVFLQSETVSAANALGVHVEQVIVSHLFAHETAWLTSASSDKERLRVVARDRIPRDAAQLFTMLHGIPLLVIAPDQIATQPQECEAH